MTEYTSSTLGLLPLPDWAKERLESLKGHQKEDLVDGPFTGEVAEVYRRARAEVVDWQTTAGLGAVGGGQLTWDDMLAHPLVGADGVDTAGIVRYYDNNNFYRRPVVRDELRPTGRLADDVAELVDLLDGGADGAGESAGDPDGRADQPGGGEGPAVQAVVPGPYTLADLATDEQYGSRDRFEEAVAAFLAGEIAEFPDAVDRLTVLEPSLGSRDTSLDADRTAALFDPVGEATGATSTVHAYWGAPSGAAYRGLLDSAVDAVGLDLVTAGAECRELVSEYGAPGRLALGVVAAQGTAATPAGDLRDRAGEFLDAAGADPAVVDLTPNAELFYLPTGVVTAKLDELGAVAGEVVRA